VVSEIPSDDTTPAQPAGVEPTSDGRIGSGLDSPTAHQELDTNIDGRAIEKSHSPSLQPCEGANLPRANQGETAATIRMRMRRS
jgi:hypothetical protein